MADTDKRRKLIGSLTVGILVLLLAAVAVWLTPKVSALLKEGDRAQWEAQIDALGTRGFFVMLLVQIAQIVVAVIPGEPIEVIAGCLYGTFGGLGFCLLGILLGSTLVLLLVRLLKYRFITLFIEREKLESYRFLQDTSRLESVTFLLFLIPGTPKDVLTYVAGLTKIKPARFLLLATLARIPSVISSTYAGATLQQGNILGTICIFAVTGAVGLLGIFFNRKLTARLERRMHEHKARSEG